MSRASRVNWAKALDNVESIHPILYEHLAELCQPQTKAKEMVFDSKHFEEETSIMSLYLPQAYVEDPPLEVHRPPKRSRVHNSESSDDLIDSDEERRVREKSAKELCPPVSLTHFRKRMRMLSKAKARENEFTFPNSLSAPRHRSEVVFPYLDLINAASSKGKAKGLDSRDSSRPVTPNFFK